MNFIIEYKALDKAGKIIKAGKMKVKNRASKFEAQCSFEKYLACKYKDFHHLQIIKTTDRVFDMFDTILKP